MSAWEKIFSPLLFRVSRDPEMMHNVAIRVLATAGSTKLISGALRNHFFINDPVLAQTIAGMRFENPIGGGAGIDKNAKAVLGLEALGFGFIELGTMTRHGQPGNPRQRMFKFPKDSALINRMGFNNEGVDAVMKRLASRRTRSIPIGVSIGKSKITPLEAAAEDYLYSFKKAYPYGDYFAVNVSSPNTPGLRTLQDKDALNDILGTLDRAGAEMASNSRKPIFVKIAPDLANEAIEEVLEVIKKNNVDGIIATNTTISRDGLSSSTAEAGGLSGRPLTEKSRKIVAFIRSRAPELPIIGVGGIMNGDDAYEMLKAGANLLQIYTGFIYGGPGTVRAMNKRLLERMRADGIKNIAELSFHS